MHYEVETKIKVKDANEMRKKIKSFAKFYKKIHKEDVYFREKSDNKGYPKRTFRIRKENGSYILNHKEGAWPRLIYSKKEFEHKIKNLEKAKAELKKKGFIFFCKKIKDCEVYKYRGASIELNKVKHLGWHVEIEVLCNKKKIKSAKEKIKKIMKLLNVKNKDIETKGYTVVLYEMGLTK
jgi:predicted adenylyl cyclase CyaB